MRALFSVLHDKSQQPVLGWHFGRLVPHGLLVAFMIMIYILAGVSRMGQEQRVTEQSDSASLGAAVTILPPTPQYSSQTFLPIIANSRVAQKSNTPVNPQSVLDILDILANTQLDGSSGEVYTVVGILYEDTELQFTTVFSNVTTTVTLGDNNASTNTVGGEVFNFGSLDQALTVGTLVTFPFTDVTPGSTAVITNVSQIMANRPVAIFQTGWSTEEDFSYRFAGAIEAYDSTKWGQNFTMPIGTNNGAAMFDETIVLITAAEDQTDVTIQNDATATLEHNSLDAGGVYWKNNISQGAKITANKNIRVYALTSKPDGTYQTRWFSIMPETEWATEYFVPATISNTTSLHLYNASGTPMPVTLQSGANNLVTVTVDKSYSATFTEPVYVNAGTTPIQAAVMVDANEDYIDWGYTPPARENIRPFLFMGMDTVPPLNQNPIHVSANCSTDSGTYLRIHTYKDGHLIPQRVSQISENPNHWKIDPNGSNFIYLNNRQMVTIFANQAHNGFIKHTGWLLSTHETDRAQNYHYDCPLAAAWGGHQNNAIDAGTIIPYLPPSYKISMISQTIDDATDMIGKRHPPYYDVISYTISIINDSYAPIYDLVINNTLPTSLEYIPNSTKIRSSQDHPFYIIDEVGQTFPLKDFYHLDRPIYPGEAIYVDFLAYGCGRSLSNTVLVVSPRDVGKKIERQGFHDAPCPDVQNALTTTPSPVPITLTFTPNSITPTSTPSATPSATTTPTGTPTSTPSPMPVPIVIGDQVWLDNNQNAIYDEGEDDTLAGVTVSLYLDDSASNTPYMQTITDGAGVFSFTLESTHDQSYSIVLDGLADYHIKGTLFPLTSVEPYQGAADVDSNATYNDMGYPTIAHITPTTSDLTLDFGLRHTDCVDRDDGLIDAKIDLAITADTLYATINITQNLSTVSELIGTAIYTVPSGDYGDLDQQRLYDYAVYKIEPAGQGPEIPYVLHAYQLPADTAYQIDVFCGSVLPSFDTTNKDNPRRYGSRLLAARQYAPD